MTFHEIVAAQGLASEEYNVTTDDGYILTMHRIYSNDATNEKKKVVFLQHGVMDASSVWILNDPENSTAFRLARDGYDVWLGNNRGSTYSRGHTSLKPDWWSLKYWDFTF